MPKRCMKCYSCTDPYYPGLCVRWTEKQIKTIEAESDRRWHNIEFDCYSGGYYRAGMQNRPSAACYRALLKVASC